MIIINNMINNHGKILHLLIVDFKLTPFPFLNHLIDIGDSINS